MTNQTGCYMAHPYGYPCSCPMAQTNTTHERTNATDVHHQDQAENPRVPNPPTPVDNPEMVAVS